LGLSVWTEFEEENWKYMTVRPDRLDADLRPELRLLLACASGKVEADRTARVRDLASGSLDWSYVIKLARRHAMVPLLHWQLAACCPDLVPPEIVALILDHFRQNVARTLLLTGELLSTLDAFSRSGIEAVPYKGPALAVSVYGHLGLRQFVDLDVIVRRSDVAAATRVLKERGYKAHFDINEAQLERFIRLSYVLSFKHSESGEIIELHWGIAPRFFGFRFDLEAMWPRLRHMKIGGRIVLAPPNEELLLMLCAHGAKDLWLRLEWVAGVAELIRTSDALDWDEVLRLARSTQSMRMLQVGVWLSQRLFQTNIPDFVTADFAKDSKAQALAARFVPELTSSEPCLYSMYKSIGLQLAFKERLFDKARFCARLGLTTTPIDWGTVSLPSSLSFLYLALRPLRLIRKHGAGAARSASR
jgi:hypothetical protein